MKKQEFFIVKGIRMQTSKSEYLFSEARKLISGGVNSPVRACGSVGGQPLFIRNGEKSKIYDVDGNPYIDYVLSWGPLILGHRPSCVIDALQKILETGTSFGAPTEIETQLARMVIDLVPSVEKIRMVNSGTEATMSAVRLARGYTGRDKIIKFAGNYHGHADSFLIQAGSGALTHGCPSSPGIPEDVIKHTLIADYNSTESVQNLFDTYG